MGAPRKKQLTIKPYKERPKLPESFFEDTWKTLEQSLAAVHRSELAGLPHETLYIAVQDLCMHRMGEELYRRLEAACDGHINRMLGELVGRSSDSIAFLEDLDHSWQEHCRQMHVIRSVFLVLDRSWALPNSRVAIWEMGLLQYRKHMDSHVDGVRQKAVDGLLRVLEMDRRKAAGVDHVRLKNVLSLMSELRIYKDVFEGQFLTATEHFYRQEGEQQLQERDAAAYLAHVEGRLNEESERVSNYMDAATRQPLLTIVEDRLLRDHVGSILEKGFESLVAAHCVSDLRRLFALLTRVDGLEQLRSAFASYIKQTGAELVSKTSEETTMVERLLAFKAQLDELLSDSFDSNQEFTHTLKESCEHFINLRQDKPAELIAKYIDGMLRTGNKGTTEEEVEAKLDRLLVFFRYVNGKDVFEAFYKKDLAKRLLHGRSGSTDAEKSMISKLKAQCGSQFTKSLEGMFKDIELSQDIMRSFEQNARARQEVLAAVGEEVDLQFSILTAVHWPSYTQAPIKLQPELSQMQDIFKNFYLEKYSGRCLEFLNTQGGAVIKAVFPAGKKDLSVSVLQAAVLLLFNEAEGKGPLPFAEIAQSTGIGEKELKRTLQSLACGKVRVLIKEPHTKEVAGTDTFSVNLNFSHKLMKIKINQIQMKETVRGRSATLAAVASVLSLICAGIFLSEPLCCFEGSAAAYGRRRSRTRRHRMFFRTVSTKWMRVSCG